MQASPWRRPRLRVLANGTPIPAVIEAEIASNNHYAADRFRVTAALSPQATEYWSNTDEIFVDVQMTLNEAAPMSLVMGATDTVEIDAIAGILRLEGRDETARFIETRTQETFANRTSSEIATELAGRHGLMADVTETVTPVGRYWQLEHDSTTLDEFARATTEWDLLTTLAQHEGFDVWVNGRTLYFQPPAQSALDGLPALRPVTTINGSANITGLLLERTLTLARDIEVTVKSWNNRQQNAFVQTTRSSRGASASTSGAGSAKHPHPQRYVYVVPNLMPDDALKLAQRKLAELSRHERVLRVDMPGELDLRPRMRFRLEGSGGAFNQIYWIDEIERRLHFEHGFTQRITGRNAMPVSQSTSPVVEDPT